MNFKYKDKGYQNNKVMDITGERTTGQKLVDLINHEFKATQSVLVQEYPSILLMTREQFDDLEALALLFKQELYGVEEDRMFKTDENYIMECRIK